MRRKSRVFLKLLLSYLGILIIPILVAFGVYGRAWQVIRAQAARTNENLLCMVQKEIDSEIKNIHKIESRLALDNVIQNLSKKRGEGQFGLKDQQSLYYLYMDLRMIDVAESFFDHVFVYFPETEKVSSSLGNMDMPLYYNLYYKDNSMSLDGFREYLTARHYNDILEVTDSFGHEMLLFTMSALNANAGEHPATIGIVVDEDQFRQKLLLGKWDERMHIRIADRENKTICMDAKSDALPEVEKQDSYIITGMDSVEADWRFEAVVPKTVIDRGAFEIQIWSAVGLFICIISGFGIASYLAKKSYNPLKMLMENFARHDNSKITAGENEYQWLNRQMNQFFKEHIDTQRLLKNSRKTLKTYYLSRLLMEHCEKSPQEQSGIVLRSAFYAVVLFKPEPQGELLAERLGEEARTLRKFIIANILGEICQEYFETEMTEMGEQEAAIVGMTEPSWENMERLQECIENLQQITEESFGFSCTALVGTACRGIGGIHESYIQAQGMKEYVNLLDTPVLRYDKVKDLRFVYEYPEEMELKIIRAMKAGDEKTAGECMMQVFDRNLSGQVKANTYQCLIFDMIGTLLKGASTGGYNHAYREISLLEQISVRTPAEQTRERFLECLDQICVQIRQIRSKASEDHVFSQKVEEYVNANFTDPDLNISIASQHFKMTPSYLSSLYKKQTGKSLLEFINNVRIDFAEGLLKEGASVSDAAERSGFRDSAGFIRAFKKKKGITPGQLKKEF